MKPDMIARFRVVIERAGMGIDFRTELQGHVGEPRQQSEKRG